MAEEVYQHPTPPADGEYVADMIFAVVDGDARVDMLMLQDGHCLIVGHYLEGRYEGKRLLIGGFWNHEIALKKWIARYGLETSMSVFHPANLIEMPVRR